MVSEDYSLRAGLSDDDYDSAPSSVLALAQFIVRGFIQVSDIQRPECVSALW